MVAPQKHDHPGLQCGSSRLKVDFRGFPAASRITYTSRPMLEENVPTKSSAAASCSRSANRYANDSKLCEDKSRGGDRAE